jgi:tetratricopeptide (TPR) repeat protein
MLKKVQQVAPDFWAWRSAEPERFAANQEFIDQEIQKYSSLSAITSWGSAVAQVGHLDRLLEIQEEFQLDKNTKFELLSHFGDVYRFLEKYQKAYTCYTKALEIVETVEFPEERARVLNKIGITMRDMKELDKALEFFQQFLSEEIEDPISGGAVLNNMGLIHLDKGNLVAAIQVLEQALKVSERSQNPQAISNTLGNLGLAYHKIAEFERAIEYYKRSLEISQKLEDQESYWKDLLNMGVAYSKLEDFKSALSYYQRASEISHQLGDLIGEKRCLIYLAECQRRIDSRASVTFYRKAMEIAQRIMDKEDVYRILIAQADMYIENDDQEKATTCYEEALKLSRELVDSDKELFCLTSLIQLYGRSDRYNMTRYKNQAKQLLERAGNLRIEMINGWLINSDDQGMDILKKDEQYKLCLNIGNIPAMFEPLENAIIAKGEFIYNLVLKMKPPIHSVEVLAKPTEISKSELKKPKDIRATAIATVEGRATTKDVDVESIEPSGTEQVDSIESKPITIATEPGRERLAEPPESEQVDVAVNIEGIGFDCKMTSNSLKTSWGYGSDLLQFDVIPRELGQTKLIIRCEANQIPFDFVLSPMVEKSIKLRTTQFSVADWKAIRDHLDKTRAEYGFPERVHGSALIGSFNIRQLGSNRRRNRDTWEFLAYICRQYDLLAIQEIMEDLSGIRTLMSLLGPEFDLIVSDISGFSNRPRTGERLGFINRSSVVQRSEISTTIRDDRVSFLMPPFCVGYRILGDPGTAPYEFMAVNAHLNHEQPYALDEFFALMDWIVARVGQKGKAYHPNFILMGDLSMDFDSPMREKLKLQQQIKQLNKITDKDVNVNFPFLDIHPSKADIFRTNARRSETFDQIGLFSRDVRLPSYDRNETDMGKNPQGPDYGVFDFTKLFAAALGVPDSQISELIDRYQYKVSDHLPLWIRLPFPRYPINK